MLSMLGKLIIGFIFHLTYAPPRCHAVCFGRVEDYALSIHAGLTSTDPVLATVWGTRVARSSVEDRCFLANGTVSSEATTHHGTADVGNDTVLVGRRGFYVRLRGHLHAKDRVVFDCWTRPLPDRFSSM